MEDISMKQNEHNGVCTKTPGALPLRRLPILFKKIRMLSLCTLLLSLFLSACAAPGPHLNARLQLHLPDDTASKSATIDKATPIDETASAPEKSMETVTPITPLPEKERYGSTRSDLRTRFDNTPSLTVAADDMPLDDFIHYIFGELLKVNYVLDSRISEKETVSLSLAQPISPLQLYDTTSDILSRFKAGIREKDRIFFIEPAGVNQQTALGFGASTADIPSLPGKITQVVPLKYTTASQILMIIANIPDIRAIGQSDENAVVLTGSSDTIAQALQFIQVLDTPALKGRNGAMLRLKYWDTDELINKLKDVLAAEGIPVSRQIGKGGLQLIPVARWQFLIVLAAEAEWLERVEYWVNLLDVPEIKDERQYFIYKPQNSRAAELLTVLQSILGLAETPATKKETKGFTASLIQPAASETDAPPERSETAAMALLADASGEISLAVDETRNALIIYATPQRFNAIESMLKRLDIMPSQVLIEAIVAEVILTDSLQFGVEWYLKNETSGIATGGADSTASTIGGLGLASAGLSYSLITRADRLKVFLNAMAQKDLVKVLQSPRVTVRDGKSASITVGTQVPVVTSEQAGLTSDTNVIRTYQYRTTGVTLNVTPVVHARDIVTLEINQEVSEASASGGENPLILNRTMDTEVVAASGQTVVIGGLIKESEGRTNSKVPFLGDIPLLKYLFTSTDQGQERTELVVMITPHIIRSTQQIEDIHRAVFDSLNFLEWSNNTTNATDMPSAPR